MAHAYTATRAPTDDPVDALVHAGQQAERLGQRPEARAHFERALFALKDASRAELAATLLRWIARTFQTDADLDAADDCLEAALAIGEACGNEASVGYTTNVQAISAWQRGQLDRAEQLYLAARENALNAGEAKLSAMTAQNLGVIANVRGDLNSALRYYRASLADYRSLGLAKDVAIALNNLGMLYTDLQRWEAAEKSYAEALHITAALGDLSAQILLAVNSAEMWTLRGDLPQARAACDRAMELSSRTRDTHAHGEAFKLYGIIAREEGDFPSAEDYLARAAAIAEQRQDPLLNGETAREQAELFFRQGRNRDTLQSLNRAHRIFSELRAQRDLADVDRRMGRLESGFLDIVQRWGDSIESKDHYTQGHCERVADLACALAKRAGLDPQSLFWFRIGALLHDVGKIVVPSEVLNKPGKLTPEEWEMIKGHPAAGVELLADIDFPWDVLPIVRSHHERWDGAGYPDRLAGESIPYSARILCVADVYDALTSRRSYKEPMSHAKAVEIMGRDIGTQFDPELFAMFVEITAASAAEAESA